MEQALLDFVRRHGLISKSDRILVAVSGGRDSMALLHVLHAADFKLGVAHMNYGLRGKDSDADADLVRQFASTLGVPYYQSSDWTPPITGSIQAKAREARYAFFEQTATEHGFSKIATAHHNDDRLESLFINLLRGTGAHGLKGIPVRRGRIIRPLLWAERREIDDYVTEHSIPFREDGSNAQDDYTRNRIRHSLIPLLSEIDPHAREKLRTSMEHLSDDAALISALASSAVETFGSDYKVSLRSLPTVDRGLWLYHALRTFGFNRAQCLDLMHAKENGKEVLSSTHHAIKEGDEVHVLPKSVEGSEDQVIIDAPGVYQLEADRITVSIGQVAAELRDGENLRVQLDSAHLSFPLVLRNMRANDHFQPLGMDYHVKLRKYLREKGWGAVEIARCKVLCDSEGQVAWIPGMQIADWCKIERDTSSVVSLSFHRHGA